LNHAPFDVKTKAPAASYAAVKEQKVSRYKSCRRQYLFCL